MQDARFSAQLKAAKLVARSEDDKTIRRVQFQLTRDFSIEISDWIGPVASSQRELMVRGDLNQIEIPIDAYHAKAAFHALGGNAEVLVDGIKATATVKQAGDDEKQREEVTLTFEAYPEGKLLTFLAASLKEHIDCDFRRSQLSIAEFVEAPTPRDKAAERLKASVEDLAGTIPKGSQMTITSNVGGRKKSATLKGTKETAEPASEETT